MLKLHIILCNYKITYWASSGSWWWTGKLGVLQSMGSQRVGHDWATELNWTYAKIFYLIFALRLSHLNSPYYVDYYTVRNCSEVSFIEVYAFISTGPAQSGILSDREVVNLFLHFTVNPKPRVEYIDRPRCCLRGKECCINRFQQVESRWGYSGTSDRIRYLPYWSLRSGQGSG